MLLKSRGFAENPPTIRSPADAAPLFGQHFAIGRREVLYALHLDAEGRVLAIGRQEGGHDRLPLVVAEIVRDACRLETRRLLLAHNHPSGDPRPSAADRIVTAQLSEMMRLLEIELIDHLIFARNGMTSFRGIGLL